MGTVITDNVGSLAWSRRQRVVFRFLAVYFFLCIFPFPFNGGMLFPVMQRIPGAMWLYQHYFQLWTTAIPWVGEHVLHLSEPITVLPNGSGDTTWSYVQILCYLVLASAIAVLWSLLDFWSKSYRRLFDWLRVYVRFYVASSMVTYGAIKVIKSQFPDPTLDRLIQPIGDSSPMGLLWTLMGSSEWYNLFTGLGEMIGGLLLTTRRTTLLGALVCFGVMSHVAALNYCYDVPVKIYSTNLVLMSVFLIAPDAGRLARVFFLNQSVPAGDQRQLFPWWWLNWLIVVARTAIVAYVTWEAIHGAYQSRKLFGDLSPRSPLVGIWAVQELSCDGSDQPPSFVGERLRRIIFDHATRMSVQTVSEHVVRFDLKLDENKQTLTFNPRFVRDKNWQLKFERPDNNTLILDGTVDGQGIYAKLKKEPERDYLLKTRGFHWINEYPFNR